MSDAVLNLDPLAKVIRALVVAPILLHCVPAMAIVYDNETRVFNGGDHEFHQELRNGSDITFNGSNLFGIDVNSGSTLTLNNATVNGGIIQGVNLRSSNVIISGGSITVSAGAGLALSRSTGSLIGSTAVVNNANISGGTTGVLINSMGHLQLANSTLTGSAANSAGLQMFGGTVIAENSTISGQANGIGIYYDPSLADPSVSTLSLANTRVQGGSGSAILVDTLGVRSLDAVINLSGTTTLEGANGNMLEVRRGAKAALNATGANLTGNITSDATSTLALNLDGTGMKGDVLVEAGGTADVSLNNQSVLTGRLENLNSLAINSQAQWVMVEDAQIANLSLNGGSVKFGEAGDFYALQVGQLSGKGTFIMDANFASGQTDFLEVTGRAEGSHELLISSTGADLLDDSRLQVVHINSGDATFALVGGEVDLGTWSYGLQQEGNDWYLDASHKTISPGTASVLALFNTAPTVWYGELSTLRSRMGELRSNGGQSGGWGRTYGSKYNVSADNGLNYSQQQTGFSLGADAPLPIGDGQWLVGVLAGHSHSDLSLERGSSGTVKSYYAGLYTTWLDAQSGYYFDGVLKYNRFNNDSKVNLSDGTRAKGDYDNSALGASAEFGRHIKLDDGYFVEPSAQLATVFIEGKNYDLDNGMQASGERTRSLLGKLGATAGRQFDLGEGRYVQPYVRAAYVREFVKNNEVSVNDNNFNNDLSGSRGELGAGLSVSIADKWDVHTDFQYSDGERISQPWGANVGVRYSW